MTFIEDIKQLAQTTNLTNREIAAKLGCSRRTVRRYAGKERLRGTGSLFYKQPKNAPKILLFDIETAPMEVYAWSPGRQYIGYDKIIKDFCLLSWAGKWLFDDVIHHECVSASEAFDRDDRSILKGLWSLLDEADIVVAHNALGFDISRVNAQFIKNDYKPTSPYRVVDTYRELKKVAWPSSWKLDYLGPWLELQEQKAGQEFGLWKKAVNGGASAPKALHDMSVYNKQDVLTLEELYLRILPWIKSHPSYGLYMDSDEVVCPSCGSEDITWKGFYYTPAGRYESFRCNQCGAVGRSRYNVFPADKRKALCLSVAR